ncbi:dermonecrotic toxin domain-containing protein [Pseudomonas sp. EA_5y_Pfl2_R50]|uniref:dermonecrotic toxin domain-containing protein n=1 Tax=Pseudomonas sp. EA_5y_Pfl2_R50 TaxID=3088691 RepID=UPI0030DA2403
MNMLNTHIDVREVKLPQWLMQASTEDQSHYAELQAKLKTAEVELDSQMGEFASVQVYARHIAGKALAQHIGLDLMSDFCQVTSRYVFQEKSRTFIQEDTLSLTDMLLQGLHEPKFRGSLKLTNGGVNYASDAPWLLELLNQNVRSTFGLEYRNVWVRSGVLAALKRVLREKLLFSAFAAKLQGHINDSNLRRIQQAVAGDAKLTVASARLLPHTRPLKDLVVIGDRSGDGNDWLLYAPGSPEGQDWYTSPSFRVLNLSISGWLAADEVEEGMTRHPQANEKGCDYLIWQSHALDRAALGSYLKNVPLKPQNWAGITLVPSPESGELVLDSLVRNERDWRIAQEESHTPYGYRTAPQEQRQQFTRLNNELKALQTIEVRQAGLVSYERFCYDLIKQRVEDVLLQRGESVSVNPDLIYVQIDEQKRMTLTELIVSEEHFYAAGVGNPLYPRYTLSGGHPEFKKLDIRDIASWSNTLRPGEKYIDMLKSVDLNHTHPLGKLKRGVSLSITARRMKVAILQARFNGQLPMSHFDELCKVVDLYAENDSRKINAGADAYGVVNHSALFKCYIEAREVVGVYLFNLKFGDRSVDYLFTPAAPDGRELRPFSEFVNSVKNQNLGDYFYDRVYVKYQPQVGTYLTDLEQLSNFRDEPKQASGGRLTRFDECYESVLGKVIDDVDGKTESLNEIINRLVWESVTLAASSIAIVYAPVGIAMSAILLSKNLVQGFEAYSEGNRAKVLSHFTEALVELVALGTAGLGSAAATPVQKTLIDLLGDAREVEKLIQAAIGQSTLDQRVIELIQEILDDPQSTSQTTLI